MKTCPHCKSVNPDEAKFCNSCGQRLNEKPDEAIDQEEPAGYSSMVPDIVSPPVVKETWQEHRERIRQEKEEEAARKAEQERLEEEERLKAELAKSAEQKEAEEARHQKTELVTIVSILTALVVVLGGVIIYQNFFAAPKPSQTPAKFQPSGRTTEETQPRNYFDDSDLDDWRASRNKSTSPAPGSTGEQDFEEVTPEDGSAQDQDGNFQDSAAPTPSNPVRNNTDNTDVQTYQANFVMKLRSNPSLSASQVGSIAQGEQVEIDQTRTDDDGSLWGQIAGSDHWVCIRDDTETYLTKK